ncbi:AGAP012659-PA-like protein [Anopheles sinensis]|uniref:AGAP012659-PA-like protein n=1 Tax=Anopheles sinensis TaxID=74873 RepID=A0A084VQS2_ANOSI|nr:AGAP012659-PA-like protein [Anopheles sinensis]
MSPYVVILVAASLGLVAGHPGGHEKCFANLTVTVDECCQIPMLAEKSIIESCRKQLPFKREHGKGAKGHGSHGSCIASCILTAMGGFKNEKLDVAGFKKSVEKVSKANPAFTKLIGQAIDECSASGQVDPAFTREPKSDDKTPSCSVAPKIFINCVYSSLFEKCPSSAWTAKTECTALKDKLKSGCPYFALRKHPKRED